MGFAKLRAAAILTGALGCFYALAPAMDGLRGNVVLAASEQAVKLTKAQAVAFAKPLPITLEGYELTDLFPDHQLSFDSGRSAWTADWSKGEEETEHKWITVDAVTGKLLNYSQLKRDKQMAADAKLISRQEALQVAKQFLKAVAPMELLHTEGPNLYEEMNPYPPRAGAYSFFFTRVEKGVPFLENDLQVTVDLRGEIVHYKRNWFDGTLPDPAPQLSEEEARGRWDETAQPTLGYAYAGEKLLPYGLKQKEMLLSYYYTEKDPALIDAQTGQALNLLGEIVSQPERIEALGKAVQAGTEQKELAYDEVREKADQIAKAMFSAQPEKGSSGASTFVSMDEFGEGSQIDSSVFLYVRPAEGGKREKRYSIGMDSYGNVTSFSLEEDHAEGKDQASPRWISYEKAQSIATDFIKQLLPDRLGSLYPISLPPTEDSQSFLFQDGGSYNLVFGWLKQGVPVESLETMVMVNPQTGEVKGLISLPPYQGLEDMEKQTSGIDRKQAKQTEGEKKTFQLTYFMPHPEWRQGSYLVRREPKLVYRMTGDEGIVDARLGQWVSFTAYKQSKLPGDITDHPQRAVLVQAVERGYFPVSEGRLNPDQLVTRGEFLRILLIANRFYGSMRFFGEEMESVQNFADVKESHPLSLVVREAMGIGLVQPAAVSDRLNPDRPITLQEANEMGNKLLGQENSAHSFWKAGKSLRLQDALTRADLAMWLSEWEVAAKNN
ncbi:YcdB/YcdC domain-containing protein [Brevibacillus nitrificans]|uniref:YcdB/YcdC domain-containing protein n=1 Tax=Brevibacillus nitrificans TaxID=651560 RepID=UPI002605EFCD|nr:YcdB/YcdC domain-containing protein [Brevibacillus nitrificans]